MRLLTPITVRSTEIPNRIVMSAMHLSYTDNGYANERIYRFYEERARGGAGLIMVGGCQIDHHGYSSMISVSDDKYIPQLKVLTSGTQVWEQDRLPTVPGGAAFHSCPESSQWLPRRSILRSPGRRPESCQQTRYTR